jgi:hypothetical protein
VQPAVRGEGGGGVGGQVVVAAHDARAADQDLPVVGDPDLGSRQRVPDGAEAEPVGAVHEAGRRGLGEAVALQDEYPGGVEELRHLGREGRAARHQEAQPTAEPVAQLAQHQAVGEGVLQPE